MKNHNLLSLMVQKCHLTGSDPLVADPSYYVISESSQSATALTEVKNTWEPRVLAILAVTLDLKRAAEAVYPRCPWHCIPLHSRSTHSILITSRLVMAGGRGGGRASTFTKQLGRTWHLCVGQAGLTAHLCFCLCVGGLLDSSCWLALPSEHVDSRFPCQTIAIHWFSILLPSDACMGSWVWALITTLTNGPQLLSLLNRGNNPLYRNKVKYL